MRHTNDQLLTLDAIQWLRSENTSREPRDAALIIDRWHATAERATTRLQALDAVLWQIAADHNRPTVRDLTDAAHGLTGYNPHTLAIEVPRMVDAVLDSLWRLNLALNEVRAEWADPRCPPMIAGVNAIIADLQILEGGLS